MSSDFLKPRPRDGTGQHQRRSPALAPESIEIDGRTFEDRVAFARIHATHLRYFDDTDTPAGNWSEFLPADLELEDFRRFVDDPSSVPPQVAERLGRPHVALFLAFLELMERPRARINAFTRRHLDHYYREVLGATPAPPVADRVSMLFRIGRTTDAVRVPAGTELDAGIDSSGTPRVYATERDLVISHASVAELRTVWVERRRTGIREAAESTVGTPESRFSDMVTLALGDPNPGDPLPARSANLEAAMKAVGLPDQPTPRDVVVAAGQLIDLVPTVLQLPILPVQIERIREIEAYFFLSADKVASLAGFADSLAALPPGSAWEPATELLTEAHAGKIYARRRQALDAERHRAPTPLAGFDVMVRTVLGVGPEIEGDLLLAILEAYVRSASDRGILEAHRSALVAGASPSDEDWARVVGILELAQRTRGHLPEPLAQRTEWRNLHAHEDARAVRPPGVEQLESPRWKTFGQHPAADEAPAPNLGWALSSPLLALSEGKRSVSVTLGFAPDGFDPDAIRRALDPRWEVAFVVEISTESGWLEVPAAFRVAAGTDQPEDSYNELAHGTPEPLAPPLDELGQLPTIRLTFNLGPEHDPTAPPQDGNPRSPWPVLRLMLRQLRVEDGFVTLAGPFEPLRLVAVHLAVSAEDLTSVRIRNDLSVLDPEKPFEPFTQRPAVGSRFLVTHPELANRKLRSIAFRFEWSGLPSDLASHYAHYPLTEGGAPVTEQTFRARFESVHRSVATPLLPGGAGSPLFPSTGRVDFDTSESEAGSTLGERHGPPPSGRSDADPLAWERHFRVELLAPDFQHAAYPSVASRVALEAAKQLVDDASGFTPSGVAPPYTPTVKTLKIDYTAVTEVLAPALESAERRGDRLFHLHPFGHHTVAADAGALHTPFLPQYPDEGELYIGIRDADLPQTLSLLLQMADGSADPDLEVAPVRWSVLTGDRWEQLHERILHDDTRGLQSTGTIELDLPAVAPSTLLPDGLVWLRASVAQHADSVCDAVDVLAQAVSATFTDRDNAPDHYTRALPPGTIRRLRQRVSGIVSVEQPFTSYGGRPGEDQDRIDTRVAERLRHRGRALAPWDYERLVLDRFPYIYKARCVPADPDGVPGQVRVVVIPSVHHQLPRDPFEPKVPTDQLAAIREHLASRAPAWADVRVINPVYVRVKVRFGVRFRPGLDEEVLKRLLSEELDRFLSPWAFDEGADIVIGSKIYANSIVDFVDRRPYVDYVATIKLFRDGAYVLPVPGQAYAVEATRPEEVLVTAREHQIDVIDQVRFDEDLFIGIGYMQIELDFVVG